MLRRILLACGVLASLLYAGTDVIAAIGYPEYHSFNSRAISELMASGAPTERLVDPFFLVYDLLIFASVGFGAAIRGRSFRLYSFATLLIMVVFGVLAALEAPSLDTAAPTPWLGALERINIGAFLLWVVVLAMILWRVEKRPKVVIPRSTRNGRRSDGGLTTLIRRPRAPRFEAAPAGDLLHRRT